jgi:hypothetical protein
MANTEVLNAAFEILVGEETYMVKHLSISSIFSVVEQKVKMERLADAKMVADIMSPNERASFLMSEWQKLPKGGDLRDLTMEFLQSVPGVICILTEAILNNNSKLERNAVIKTVSDAISLSNVDLYVKQAFRVLGVEENEEEKATDPKKK